MEVTLRVEAVSGPPDAPRALDVGEAYAAWLPLLRRIAAGVGLVGADAEDALHDAYLALMRNRRRFSESDSARRWLIRVTVNRCLLHHRQRSHRREQPIGATDRPASESASAADEQAIRAAMEGLDGESRALLAMRYFCDLSATEIGAALAVPPGTIRTRLRSLRMRLAEVLLKEGVDHVG
jgi:RNA polymerase sigma-70 factor (ECF subfamily)